LQNESVLTEQAKGNAVNILQPKVRGN